MSRIKGTNTKPEKIIRKMLHKMGYRFRLHRKDLPGKPDIVLPKYNKVIFVNGCFWHGHRNCKKAELPESNRDFWKEKIRKTQLRDKKSNRQLKNLGWNVLTIWQCELINEEKLLGKINSFMAS